MTAVPRQNSLRRAEGMANDRRSASRGYWFLPDRNFGGVSARFGAQGLHHFFGLENQPRHRLLKSPCSRRERLAESELRATQKVRHLREIQIYKASDYVDEAARWASCLTEKEVETSHDTGAALKAVARKTGVALSMLWSLRYRKPKDITVSIYMRLKGAYEAEIVRQKGLLAHEIEITRRVAGDRCVAVVEAQAALDALDGELDG